MALLDGETLDKGDVRVLPAVRQQQDTPVVPEQVRVEKLQRDRLTAQLGSLAELAGIPGESQAVVREVARLRRSRSEPSFEFECRFEER